MVSSLLTHDYTPLKDGLPEDVYSRLSKRERGFRWLEQYDLLVWLSGGGMVGESLSMYGERTGVPLSTLRNWRDDPDFEMAWAARVVDNRTSPDTIDGLMEELHKIALKATHDRDRVTAIKAYMDFAERISPRGRILPDIGLDRPDDELTDEELEQKVAAEEAK